MNRGTSIYLDLIRFSAAMVVLIGHLSGTRFTGGLFWRFGAFMDDAVMVFFVLSGFVIGYVVHHKEKDLTTYVIARTARIYSVAIPALGLTLVLDALGRTIAPQLYVPGWGYHANNLFGHFLACLFFVNQLWYVQIAPGSMLPYWSLGFEVWYYLFFAIFFFASSYRRTLLLIGACLIAGPRIVVFFPIWLLGYLTYLYSVRHTPSRYVGILLLFVSALGYGLYFFVLKDWLARNTFVPDALGFENLVPRYIVGLLFATHILGFAWTAELFLVLLTPFKALIRWLGGATFTIYLFHLPVAQFLTTLVPWSPSDFRTRIIVLGGTIVLMFVIAIFTERQKAVWTGWITHAYKAMRPDRNIRQIPARDA
jgi:peptidoglycan/LPS O-acetylase OafA/YrhL